MLMVESRNWCNNFCTRCCRGNTCRGSSAQIWVDWPQWRNAKLSHCSGENHFCFYKLGCAVLLFPASFSLLLLAVIYRRYSSTCKSLHNIPAPEIRHFMLLARPGHASYSLCLWFFTHLLSEVAEPLCLQWVSPSLWREQIWPVGTGWVKAALLMLGQEIF